MCLHERRAEADLALSGRHAASVINLDQHRDVRGLYQIEQVFARKIEYGADKAKADDAAPERSACRRACTDVSETPAEGGADADREDVGQCDCGIDDDAQDDERKCLKDHSNCLAEAEIPHFLASPKSRRLYRTAWVGRASS